MKRSADYILTELAGSPYLCPVGQGVVKRRRHLALNRTSLFLWKTLTESEDFSSFAKDEAALFLADALKAFEEELPPVEELVKDIRSFLDTLYHFGVLEEETVPVLPPSSWFRIGRVILKVEGKPYLLTGEMEPFRINGPAVPDLIVSFEDPLLIRDPELQIVRIDEGFLFQFPDSVRIESIRMSADGKQAFVRLCGFEDTLMQDDLFHALRLLVSYTAQKKKELFLHSASLLYKGKAWLFSAPSGTGKSTHTALWKKLFSNEVEDINGDLNLLSLNENSSVSVEGIPWNGTSGIYRNGEFPLGGIVFLHQAAENHVGKLSSKEGCLALLQRIISPFWTKPLLEKNIALVEKIADAVPMFSLSCTKDDEAAILMRKKIDELT